jgi:hypothetical protein
MAVFVDAMVLEIAPQPGMKKNPNTPHIARLEAIMDVLGYEGFGGQKRFADEIGVNYNDFNQMATGTRSPRPLHLRSKGGLGLVSISYGTAIMRRFQLDWNVSFEIGSAATE